jgi:hypothetical protein
MQSKSNARTHIARKTRPRGTIDKFVMRKAARKAKAVGGTTHRCWARAKQAIDLLRAVHELRDPFNTGAELVDLKSDARKSKILGGPCFALASKNLPDAQCHKGG